MAITPIVPIGLVFILFEDKITESYQNKGDTVIGDGVWIGMRAMIMPGIKIGEGAIIASGAVVTKDVAPYTIVAGNPAKEVKKRFDTASIDTLLKLKIYDWDVAKFNALKDYICSDNIDNLVLQSQLYDTKNT